MNQATILIVEDDSSLRDVLVETLLLEKYRTVTAVNGEDALQKLEQNTDIALVLSDVQMQPMDGGELLKICRCRYPELPFIMMTAYGTIEDAVSAMHNGVSDYLVKPFESETLIEVVGRFVTRQTGKGQGLIAVDENSIRLADVAKRVASTEVSVMISGESGVGKEVVSRYMHENSSRSNGPFVAINCAAIPENMLEAELFGYEKGAFTGAHQSRAGKFEQAQGGTLLLDEITEMDLALQAKLLRVLQEKEVERLGGRKVIPLDVRILATTNRNIINCVAEGTFREDLFYRLNVFPLHIQPLRERIADIMPLSSKLLSRYAAAGETVSFSESAKRKLLSHNWPGNVRELENVVQRALILKTGNTITDGDIHLEIKVSHLQHATDKLALAEENGGCLNSDLRAHEHDLIISALQSRCSRKEVAKKLGISSRTLRYKLAKMRDAGVAIPA